jgi:GntR family transcriptional regulator
LLVAEPLMIVIDRDREASAYEQIAAQIREAIVSSALLPGTVLPGVRGLASDLGVNLNTVARAYRLLEDQGFVRIRDRSGVEVVMPAQQVDRDRREVFERELWELLVRMRQAGWTAAELRRLVIARLDALER